MTVPRVVIVTPVRDEERHLALTIESVVAQTARPAEWVIVNDGSSDGTAKIADQAAATYEWIQVVHRADRGFRKAGEGVVAAFSDGLSKLRIKQWEYLVKLDGDLSFDPDYFASCLSYFAKHPRLGIAGGTVCKQQLSGGFLPEFPHDPAFHVRGATKIYRRPCWDDIGGLVAAAGWDTLDEVKANMLGWRTLTLPNVRLVQHRPTGGAAGTWRNYFKNGQGSYLLGYHPAFMGAKCIRRCFHRPFLVVGLALFAGFASGYLKRLSRVGEANVIRYLRRQQLRRLCFRSSIWT